MATRPVRFETHIRPLMRVIDRDNMLWRLDLWSYDDVRTNADEILQRLQVDMPPQSYGGLWPEEWITLFQRWKNEGYLRLDLGSVDAIGYTARLTGTTVLLTCRGTTPSRSYRAWLEAYVPENSRREYFLYWEPPVSPQIPPMPTVFRARAIFEQPAGMTEIVVTDATGRHIVPITVAPILLTMASLDQVDGELVKVGGTVIQTIPTNEGSVTRYRVGSDDVEVFWDDHRAEVLGPPEFLNRLKQSLGEP